MIIDRKRAQEVFLAYAARYDANDPKIRLKIEHTLKVTEAAERIAVSLGMGKEDRDLAWLLGLLHDVGRFEQVRRYGTFSDAKSISHAHLGAEILFDGADSATGIRDFVKDPSEDGLIRRCIELHSDFRLPPLDARTDVFAKLLRDADKVDILRVAVTVPRTDIYGISEEELKSAPVTPAVLENFFRHSCIDRQLKKTPADSVIGHISLVFELEFPESVRMVREQGYLLALMDFESDSPGTRDALRQVREEMERYMAETASV